MVTIGHINAIHGLQNVPHSGEEDGPRGRMRDGRGIEEGREGGREREGSLVTILYALILHIKFPFNLCTSSRSDHKHFLS